MNLIIDKLPYYVYINNEKYKVNVDFRVMLKFEKVIQDRKLKDNEKIFHCLKLFYPDFFKIISQGQYYQKEAIEKLIWFYKCGRDYEEPKTGNGTSHKSYDIDYDAEYICGAFMHDYGIDLTNCKLHWWRYKSYFKSLNSKNEFIKIIGYRNYKGDDKDIKKLKEAHALPLSKEEQEEIDELVEKLQKKPIEKEG